MTARVRVYLHRVTWAVTPEGPGGRHGMDPGASTIPGKENSGGALPGFFTVTQVTLSDQRLSLS